MIMTDPIADMLTRVRNAQRAGHRRVDIPLSKEKAAIARKLAETHFITNYKVLEANGTAVLRVYLKYTPDGRPVIRGMRRVSKPGHRTYVKVREIPLVRGGLGVAILSTSRGILTDREARAAGVGGELVAIVH